MSENTAGERGPKITIWLTGTSYYLYELYPEARQWSKFKKLRHQYFMEVDPVSQGVFGVGAILFLMIIIVAAAGTIEMLTDKPDALRADLVKQGILEKTP